MTKAAVKHTPRLADVAARAGVDTSTVSRILNNPGGHRISAPTRDRVLAAAADLNYRPNLMARGLRTAKSRTLALIVPQINTQVYAEIIAGATSAVRDRNYTLLIAQHEEEAEGEPVYKTLYRTNQVDGLIVVPRRPHTALLGELASVTIPLVVAHRRVPGIEHCVTIDSFAAAQRAAAHLIGLGHRRIAYVARRTGYYNDSRRLAGFKAAFADAGLAFDPSLLAHAPHTYDGAHAQTLALLRTAPVPPTAIFNVSLIAAAGTMAALARHDLRVPEDVSLVALYDHEFADVLRPSVTTMRMPLQELGARSVSLLLDLVEGRAARAERVLQPGELIVRASSAPPRG